MTVKFCSQDAHQSVTASIARARAHKHKHNHVYKGVLHGILFDGVLWLLQVALSVHLLAHDATNVLSAAQKVGRVCNTTACGCLMWFFVCARVPVAACCSQQPYPVFWKLARSSKLCFILPSIRACIAVAQVCKRHGINHTTIQIERAGTNDLDNCSSINVVCDSS